jgi:hypothetical protein
MTPAADPKDHEALQELVDALEPIMELWGDYQNRQAVAEKSCPKAWAKAFQAYYRAKNLLKKTAYT